MSSNSTRSSSSNNKIFRSQKARSDSCKEKRIATNFYITFWQHRDNSSSSSKMMTCPLLLGISKFKTNPATVTNCKEFVPILELTKWLLSWIMMRDRRRFSKKGKRNLDHCSPSMVRRLTACTVSCAMGLGIWVTHIWWQLGHLMVKAFMLLWQVVLQDATLKIM